MEKLNLNTIEMLIKNVESDLQSITMKKMLAKLNKSPNINQFIIEEKNLRFKLEQLYISRNIGINLI